MFDKWLIEKRKLYMKQYYCIVWNTDNKNSRFAKTICFKAIKWIK